MENQKDSQAPATEATPTQTEIAEAKPKAKAGRKPKPAKPAPQEKPANRVQALRDLVNAEITNVEKNAQAHAHIDSLAK